MHLATRNAESAAANQVGGWVPIVNRLSLPPQSGPQRPKVSCFENLMSEKTAENGLNKPNCVCVDCQDMDGCEGCAACADGDRLSREEVVGLIEAAKAELRAQMAANRVDAVRRMSRGGGPTGVRVI